MKTFAYTLRNKSGALQKGSLQAQDRQDALQKIRSMGGTPVNVTEGGVPKASFAWQPAWTRAACVLGVGAALLAGVAFWLQRPRAPRAEPIPARPAAPLTPAPSSSLPKPSPVVPKDSVPTQVVAALPTAQVSAATTPTLPEIPPAAPAVPAADAAAAVHTNRPVGVRIFSKNGVELTNKAPKFTTQTDRFLWGILKNPGGTATAVLSPTLIARDFEKALANKLPVSPDDDAETVALKRKIDEIKAEIAALVKQGDDLHDIIRDIQRDYNEAADTRREARRNLFDLIKQGDLEAAATYQKESNEALKKRGLDPISVPAKLLEAAQEKPDR